jgi:hypothetical protein
MADAVSTTEPEITSTDLGVKPESQTVAPRSPLEELKKIGLDSRERALSLATDENFLGAGGNATVFAIPADNEHVIRIQTRAWNGSMEGELEAVEDPFPEFNVGQAVAKMGNVFILRRQEGVPAGLTHTDIKRLGFTQEVANEDYLERTARAANLPQEAYDELAKLFKVIIERGYKTDPSKPNNLLVDTEKQRFNLVDVTKNNSPRYKDDLGAMIGPLINTAYAHQVQDPSIEQQLVPLRAMIIDKAIQASINENLPYNGSDEPTVKYAFILAGREEQWPTQKQALISTTPLATSK